MKVYSITYYTPYVGDAYVQAIYSTREVAESHLLREMYEHPSRADHMDIEEWDVETTIYTG